MRIELRNCLQIMPVDSGLALHEAPVFIRDGVICEELVSADRVIDCGGRIVLPGLVNAHHHIYSNLAKGIAVAGPMRGFSGILEKLWWRLDRTLNEEDVILSTAQTLEDCIRSGVTTVFDHHISSSFIDGSLQRMGEVFDAYGLNGVLCFEISGRNGKEIFRQSLDENIRFRSRAKGNLRGVIGLHASFTLSDEQLREIAERIDGAPIHIHVAEAEDDIRVTREISGLGIVERLWKFGLLNRNSLLVHCNLLEESEMREVAHLPVYVVHNIESAMNNALTIGNIHRMIKLGVRLAAGTDGMSSNILKALRTSVLYTKQLNRDPDIGYGEFQSMLLQNWNMKRTYGFPLGLTKGETADLAVFDYVPVTPIHDGNLIGHLLFGVAESTARWVIKDRNVLLDDGRLVSDCCDDRLSKNRRIAQRLHERFITNQIG